MNSFVRYMFIIILLSSGIFIAGCDNRPFVQHGTNHPGYIDSAFVPFKSLAVDSITHLIRVDSIYSSLNDPGPGDRWDKYFVLFLYTNNDLKNPRLALKYIDSMQYAIQKYQEEGEYIELYARTLFYKGDVLLVQGRYAESFTLYYKAREIILQENDLCILSEYSERLANATFRQGQYKDAAEYFKQAADNLERCVNQTSARFGEIQGTLDNIGIAYFRAGMLDSADAYFNKALAYIESNARLYPDRTEGFIDVAKAVIYGNQAGVAIKRKQFAVAEKLLKESIAISFIPGNPKEDAGYSYIKLAGIYLQQGRLAEAETQLNKLAELQKNYSANTDLLRNLNLLRSQLAALKGDNSNAYRYLLEYQNGNDSIMETSAHVAATDMKQAINKRTADYLWLTIIIASLAFVIVVQIWFNYRRYKKNVASLVNLNDAVNYKNQALLQTLAALEQSHNNNTRLLKVVAHDLRGPLGAITSIAELGRDGMLPGEKYQEVMGIIFRSGTKALTLANDLLIDMQTLGQLTNAEPLNIGEQLASCVELYAHKIHEKAQGITLKTMPAIVSGDREKLWRLFSNLISNAVKFTRVGGEIRISMHTHESDVIISVNDNGIGIPDDIKDRIFEPTEATTRPGTAGERSFGLGLSISKNIVALHNGLLWFESSYAEGTTFFVSIPLLQPDNEIKSNSTYLS
jgi:signal transduction histidine kinase